MKILLLLTLVFSSLAHAADWYVRPPVISSYNPDASPNPTPGIYGDQNGTSYANAWNGLRSVVWGSGGVTAGDTLWVCGKHIHKMITGNLLTVQAQVTITASGTAGNPITIRGDYPNDPGEVWGWFHDKRPSVSFGGPDVNGVYWQTNTPGWGNLYVAMAEIVDGVPRFFEDSGTNTWVGGLGQQHPRAHIWTLPGTNYLKTFSGSAPTSDTILNTSWGYRFNLLTNSFITFKNLKTLGTVFSGTKWTAGQEDTFNLSRNIVVEGCHIIWNGGQFLYPGWDNWSYVSNRFETNAFHIYTLLDSRTRGPTNLYIGHNIMMDTSHRRLYDQDGHAIGVQGGWGHLVEYNDIRNCRGSAIEFWTYSQAMSNMVVRWNYVKDTQVNFTSGAGIVVSGDNVGSVPGLRTGYQIYGNIIDTTGIGATEAWQGSGIGSNNKDPMDVFNNVILNPRRGISVSVNTTGKASGRFFNNMIVNPATGVYWVLSSPETPSIEISHNLYYPATSTSGFNSLFSYGSGNVFAEPQFVVGENRNNPNDYKLLSSSPAIGSGINLPYTILDFNQNNFKNPPSIGAHEFYLINSMLRVNSSRFNSIYIGQ